jgi:hypothetical protein
VPDLIGNGFSSKTNKMDLTRSAFIYSKFVSAIMGRTAQPLHCNGTAGKPTGIYLARFLKCFQGHLRTYGAFINDPPTSSGS